MQDLFNLLVHFHFYYTQIYVTILKKRSKVGLKALNRKFKMYINDLNVNSEYNICLVLLFF